jgi:hypothetical protein
MKIPEIPQPFSQNDSIISNGNKSNNQEKTFLQRFKETEITDQSDIADPVPFVTVNGSTFASLGDISFISGVPKSGKSSVTGFIIATALMKEKPIEFDSLGIIANYQEQRPIIYIDTEQHPAHTKKRLTLALRMAGIARQDQKLLKVMNWRTVPQKQRHANLMHALDHFQDACLWIIDGITDFVTSANNEEAGTELISHLMQKASQNNAAIILLIHENAQNGKLRGHIGSEAERKCGGSISIKKDNEKGVHFIEPKYLRDDGNFPPVVFRYDKTQGRMVSVDKQDAQQIIKEQNEKSKGSELRQLYEKCMGLDKKISRSEFRRRIQEAIDPDNKRSNLAREQAANRKIEDMEKTFLIRVKGSGRAQTVETYDEAQPEELFEPLAIIQEPKAYVDSAIPDPEPFIEPPF